MADAASLVLERLKVTRGGTSVIDGVTLSIAAGERVFLLGPNGAGKTSLLLAAVGALPFEGSVRIAGVAVEPKSLAEIRQNVGFVFADPSDQFFLDEVTEEIAFGPRQRGLDDARVQERVTGALGAVGLLGHAGRSPHALSLGEQRRLAVATALAFEPGLFLFDEPTAALDPRARRGLLGVIGALASTLVVATHDLDAALSLGGRAILLRDGHVVADGRTEDLLVDEEALDRAGLGLPAP